MGDKLMMRPALAHGIALAALVALVAAGLAAAAIPDEDGVISACYKKRGGSLRVIDSGASCRRGERRIEWNEDGGAEGPEGRPGPAGAAGPQGPAGLDGNPGPIGPAGPAGSEGAAGADGAPGVDGASGPQGAPGPTGATGPAGETGATGPLGPQGPVGVRGPTGARGATGPTGATGPQGPAAPGKSHFFVGVAAGGISHQSGGFGFHQRPLPGSFSYSYSGDLSQCAANATATDLPNSSPVFAYASVAIKYVPPSNTTFVYVRVWGDSNTSLNTDHYVTVVCA